MSDKNSCISTFNTHEEAEQAVRDLERAGLDMKKLAIVGKGYEQQEHVLGYYNMSQRTRTWGKRGAFWGGLWGIVFNPAFMCVPGTASLTAGGMLFVILASGLSTAIFAGGLTALGAALYSLGVPKNSIIQYETAIKMEKFLLIVYGARDEVDQASDILSTGGKEAGVAVYSA